MAPRISPLSIALAVLLAALLLLIAFLAVRSLARITAPPKAPGTSALTMIPAPTHTPTSIVPTAFFTPTPGDPFLPSGMMGVGAYVKVANTQGAGLRVRSAGSTSAGGKFVAMDEEVFFITGGPEQADGYTWWQLEAPYDENRSGWAVGNFLEVIELSTPAP